MTIRVPYIADSTIERDAEALLAQYAYAKGEEIQAPIPIEDIVEKHLKLRIELDDLRRLLDFPHSGPDSDADIFGAIWLDSGRIVIDESLDPEERPGMEGRYRFTLAHEGGGHWRLHRGLVRVDSKQTAFFANVATPTVICRSSQAKKPVEWQADFYASCLLMPRKLVFSAWDESFPDRKQRVLQPATPIEHPFAEISRIKRRFGSAEFTESDDEALDRFAKPLAERFLVSPIAMRIRLERLGLLHRTVPLQRLLVDDLRNSIF